jgi:hypothetical protein
MTPEQEAAASRLISMLMESITTLEQARDTLPALRNLYADCQQIIALAGPENSSHEVIQLAQRFMVLCHELHFVDPPPAPQALSA